MAREQGRRARIAVGGAAASGRRGAAVGAVVVVEQQPRLHGVVDALET